MIIVRNEAFYISNKVRPMWTAGYHTDRLAWHLVRILMNILSSGKESGYKAATAAGKVSSESVNDADVVNYGVVSDFFLHCPHAIPRLSLVLCLIMRGSVYLFSVHLRPLEETSISSLISLLVSREIS